MANRRNKKRSGKKQNNTYLVKVAWVLFFILILYGFWPFLKSLYRDYTTHGNGYGIERYTDLEIPDALKGKPEQIIRHKGYTVSYNKDWHIPNWVAYELILGELDGPENRYDKFMVDPYVKGMCATNADYSRSGYDKGHMAPAGDMTWNKTAMKESFYFTNICPQHPGLNRGVWKNLEEKIRDRARKDSCVLVVCGPLAGKNDKTIGKNKVKVPHGFFKVVLTPYAKHPKGIGFIFDNKKEEGEPAEYAVSIDSVEELTGIDFFSRLPDEVEEKLESSYDIGEWKL